MRSKYCKVHQSVLLHYIYWKMITINTFVVVRRWTFFRVQLQHRALRRRGGGDRRHRVGGRVVVLQPAEVRTRIPPKIEGKENAEQAARKGNVHWMPSATYVLLADKVSTWSNFGQINKTIENQLKNKTRIFFCLFCHPNC